MNTVTRYFLAAVLLLSGIDKVAHYAGFVTAVGGYAIVPVGFAPYLAPFVLLVELSAGLALLTTRHREAGAAASGVLLSTFTAAYFVNWYTNASTVCGCWFTLTLAEGTGTHIALNLVLIALSALVWFAAPVGIPRAFDHIMADAVRDSNSIEAGQR